MQPNQYNQQFNYSDRPTRSMRGFKIFAIAMVALILIILGLSLHRASQFHMVSATPDLDHVAAISPDITFNFDRDLKSDPLSLTSTANIAGDVKINGKSLTVAIAQPLTIGTEYSLTFSSISSTDGATLTNQTYTFTAKDIAFQDLSKEQQQTILAQQQKKPAGKDFSSSYFGETELLNSGLTQDQVDDIKQGLYNYLTAAKAKAAAITFSKATPAAPHPDDPLGPDVRSFAVSLDDKAYSAKVSTSDISTARLYLYDASGKLLYDSKDLNPLDHSSSNCRAGGCQ